MNIIKQDAFCIKAIKAGKGEQFHLKPYPVTFKDSMSRVEWIDNETYLSTNFFIVTRVQIFWLWFILDIKFNKEKLSEMKFVNYNATHYASIEDALQ